MKEEATWEGFIWPVPLEEGGHLVGDADAPSGASGYALDERDSPMHLVQRLLETYCPDAYCEPARWSDMMAGRRVRIDAHTRRRYRVKVAVEVEEIEDE